MKSRKLEYGMGIIYGKSPSAALHRRRLSLHGVVAAPLVGSAPEPDNLADTGRRPSNNIDPGSPVLHAPSYSSPASPNSPASTLMKGGGLRLTR
jgi:hypothetical protein